VPPNIQVRNLCLQISCVVKMIISHISPLHFSPKLPIAALFGVVQI
jgi:hypothetical protein